MHRTAILLICLGGATQCVAGPWPRDAGTLFTSTGLFLSELGELSTSYYLEYGLTARWSVSGKAYLDTDPSSVSILGVAAEYHPPFQALDFPVSLGLGIEGQIPSTDAAAENTPIEVIPGIAIGRALEVGGISAWATASASHRFGATDASGTSQVASQFGLHLPREALVFVDARAELKRDGNAYSITPSYARAISEGTHLQLFFTAGTEPLEVGVSVWHER